MEKQAECSGEGLHRQEYAVVTVMVVDAKAGQDLPAETSNTTRISHILTINNSLIFVGQI